MIQEARDRAMLIDASYGRKTRAVLLMDTDHVDPFGDPAGDHCPPSGRSVGRAGKREEEEQA